MSFDDMTDRQATPEEWADLCRPIRNPRTRQLAELGIMRSITDREGTTWVAPNHIEANACFEAMSSDGQRELLVHRDTLNTRDRDGAPRTEKHS